MFMREKIFATRCASLIGNWQTTTPRQRLSQEEVTAMLGKIGGEVNYASRLVQPSTDKLRRAKQHQHIAGGVQRPWHTFLANIILVPRT